MRHRLRLEQWVPYALPDVFNFFADPGNLPPLMPGWQRARIDRAQLVAPLQPQAPRPRSPGAVAGAGSRLLISFRPVPLSPARMRWDAFIAEFAWDDHFCDEQIAGPFGYWRHCHRVREAQRNGARGTVVVDEVAYAFPLGVLGDAAYAAGGARQVRALFLYRQRQLLKLLPHWVVRG